MINSVIIDTKKKDLQGVWNDLMDKIEKYKNRYKTVMPTTTISTLRPSVIFFP